jgi:dTDP-4-dehydrorhamnose reductase
MNSRMNGEKLARTLKFEMPDWQDATRQVMQDVLSEKHR